MKMSEITEILDRKGSFLMVIDSGKDYAVDAMLEQPSTAPDVQQMIVDRIAYFANPVLVYQWSDCKEDYHFGPQCSDVYVVFAHNDGEEVKSTKLKSEIYDDLQSYVDEINARHSESYSYY